MDPNSAPETNGPHETRFSMPNPPLTSRLVDVPINQALRQISQSLAPLQMIPAQIATLASQVASMQVKPLFGFSTQAICLLASFFFPSEITLSSALCGHIRYEFGFYEIPFADNKA